MPTVRILAVAALLLSGPAFAGGQAMRHGGYSGGGWGDVPPVALNMPNRAASGGSWHGTAPPQSSWNSHGGYGGNSYSQSNAVSQSGSYTQDNAYANGQRGHGGYSRGYAHMERGHQLPGYWMSPSYQVSDWRFYGLSEPGYGRHWVRYYDDAVLVDEGGSILNVVDDLDWDRVGYASEDSVGYQNDGAYSRGVPDYGARYGGMAPGSYYAPPAYAAQPAPLAAGPPVTWSAPVAASVVVVQGAPVVTTTTTTTTTYVDEVSYRTVAVPARRKVWHRPAPRRRVTCCCLCTR